MYKEYIISAILLLIVPAHTEDSSKIAIVVLSQKEGYHAALAELSEQNIKKQAEQHQLDVPDIVLTHELDIPGSWTVKPLITYLLEKFPKKRWFVFCTEATVIQLPRLLKLLKSYSSKKEFYLGHALYDHDPTIIHHFAQDKKKFKYPNFSSGFAISKPLMRKLKNKVSSNAEAINDFSIDASYEFSKFVFGSKIRLTHNEKFCIVSSSECAAYPKHIEPCSNSLSNDDVYVAVKTCNKFHSTRIPIIRETWTKYAKHIGFYSDVADQRIPNVYMVPNTTEGHCAKTYALLQHANDVLVDKNIKWLVITDDDTIMSLGNLLRLLTCYNPATFVALGERYGYHVTQKDNGYDYLTGGAGVVLSAPLVKSLVEPETCNCPAPNAPDDMFLFGACLSRVNVNPTHIPSFHQARPQDYSPGYLSSHDPISFHKFYDLDARMVYDHYFRDYDSIFERKIEHTEL